MDLFRGSKSSKTWWFACIGALVVVGVIAAVWWPRSAKPATAQTPTLELIKFGATDDFKNLSKEKKKAYADELARRDMEDLRLTMEKLNEDERMKFMLNNIRDNPITRMIDGYYALPEGKERTAYLDKRIDEFEKRRQEAEKRAATQPASTQPAGLPWARGGGNPITMMKNMIENIPPDQMARYMEFRKVMRDRRAERGIAEPKFGAR